MVMSGTRWLLLLCVVCGDCFRTDFGWWASNVRPIWLFAPISFFAPSLKQDSSRIHDGLVFDASHHTVGDFLHKGRDGSHKVAEQE